MIDLLIILLRPALLYVEDKATPWWRLDLALVAIVAWWVDVTIAHTTWRVMTGPLLTTEWTISHTLERLCVTPGPDQQLYIEIAKKINRESPSGNHIKAVQHGTKYL